MLFFCFSWQSIVDVFFAVTVMFVRSAMYHGLMWKFYRTIFKCMSKLKESVISYWRRQLGNYDGDGVSLFAN